MKSFGGCTPSLLMIFSLTTPPCAALAARAFAANASRSLSGFFMLKFFVVNFYQSDSPRILL